MKTRAGGHNCVAAKNSGWTPGVLAVVLARKREAFFSSFIGGVAPTTGISIVF